jgi:hypothetical protein
MAAVSSFVVELKNAALPKLVGLVQPLLADVESYAGSIAEQKLEQLFHYIASLPVGSEIMVLAEGYAVKVVGNGLPQHGAGGSLLHALEEALGIPSVIQPAATPEQVAAQSLPSAAGQAPVPPVILPATPTVPKILQTPPAKAPSESIVQKVEGVLEGIFEHAVAPAAAVEPVVE